MIELAVTIHRTKQGVRVIAQDGTGRRLLSSGPTLRSALGKLGAYIAMNTEEA